MRPELQPLDVQVPLLSAFLPEPEVKPHSKSPFASCHSMLQLQVHNFTCTCNWRCLGVVVRSTLPSCLLLRINLFPNKSSLPFVVQLPPLFRSLQAGLDLDGDGVDDGVGGNNATSSGSGPGNKKKNKAQDRRSETNLFNFSSMNAARATPLQLAWAYATAWLNLVSDSTTKRCTFFSHGVRDVTFGRSTCKSADWLGVLLALLRVQSTVVADVGSCAHAVLCLCLLW